MNTTELKNIVSYLEMIVDTATKFKNAYFWHGRGNSSQRQSYDEYYSIPEKTFVYNGIEYSVEYRVTSTRNNVYANGIYKRDGKKTTLTAIKNVMKKMYEEIERSEFSYD